MAEEIWLLSKLKKHPDQDRVFPQSDEEIWRMADHMKRYGQSEALQVLPNGVVLSGHTRWLAAEKIGWYAIRVVVREFAENIVEANRVFVDSNLVRKQLGPLGKARAIKYRLELDGCLSARGKKEAVKAAIGVELGVSRRTVDRYLRALTSEMCVQTALEKNEIGINDISRLTGLPREQQREIIAGLHLTGELRLPPRRTTSLSAFKRMLTHLETAVRDVNVNEVPAAAINNWLSTLNDYAVLLSALQKKGKKR